MDGILHCPSDTVRRRDARGIHLSHVVLLEDPVQVAHVVSGVVHESTEHLDVAVPLLDDDIAVLGHHAGSERRVSVLQAVVQPEVHGHAEARARRVPASAAGRIPIQHGVRGLVVEAVWRAELQGRIAGDGGAVYVVLWAASLIVASVLDALH